MRKSKILLTVIILINIYFILPAQQLQEGGYQIFDTINLSGTVLINNDLFIDSNEILIIAPGSILEFQGHYQIKVVGLVKAIGTEADSIIFTINDNASFSDSSTIAGGWKGINFWDRNENDTSFFSYCRFEYGKCVTSSNSDKDSKGGAIFLSNYSGIWVSNCTFNNNLATKEGGGIYSYETSVNIITDNIFTHNKTYHYGGGIKIQFGNNIYIANNLFQYNTAFNSYNGWQSGEGSGININTGLSNANIEVYNNKLFNNTSLSTLYESCNDYLITNNIICNNYGAAFYSGHSMTYGKFINNTVSNNYLEYFSGITIWSRHIQIKNNIIWNNISIVNDTIQIFDRSSLGADIEYNCVQYGYEGNGNIKDPPMFVNPTKGAGLNYNGTDADWSLLDSSPCINTGTPDTSGLNLPEFDIDGNQRVYGNRIDMGAYENQYVWVKINDSPVFNNSIKVYPNPGTNLLNLKTNNEELDFELININGQTVIKQMVDNNYQTINTELLKSGIYFYRLINKQNNTIETGKWIKK